MPIYTTDATLVWRALNGICCIYKPAGVAAVRVRETLTYHLCKELNDMKVRPPIDYVHIRGKTNRHMLVDIKPSYADHPLVVGPRYQHDDVKSCWANFLNKDTSGVLMFGLNDGTKSAFKLQQSKPTSFYRVKGLLGQATDNYFITGKVMERSTYKFIRRGALDNLCASMQMSHQKKMFEYSGVSMESQAAYELAVKGPIRPSNHESPLIYSIKCVEFVPPEFTLEIVCINENEMYLKTLIHDIGMRLHSTATCTKVQCFQFGLFNTSHALLKKHWTIQHILHNMKQCNEIIENNPFLLHQDSPQLMQIQTN